jgi:glycine hydroxymethyltransferase
VLGYVVNLPRDEALGRTTGMTESEMESIARWIYEGVDAARRGDEATIERIAAEVRELTTGFPIRGSRV